MFFSIASSLVMGGVAGFAYLKTNGPATNDYEKIKRIFEANNWAGAKGETIRIHKKNPIKQDKKVIGTEYVIQIPLGFDRKKVDSNIHILQDGLNIRSKVPVFDPRKLLNLKWDRTIPQQIKAILTETEKFNKEIELEFDGMLKIRVYNERLPDSIIWNETMLKADSWAVSVGVIRSGVVYHDFDQTKHIIIAGVPGSGKSVIMKLVITSLVLQKPNDVSFSLIDLKGGPAFARFKNIKQVKNLAINNTEALAVLKEIQADMERVYQDVLVPNGFEDVKEAGIKARHFIVIDEAADLADDKEAVEILTDIVRKGRGSGHYVIYSTQYPTVQTVASQIKRNIPARLTYVLDSAIASNAVLDTNGAEQLPAIPGRGIYRMVKQNIIQTPFLSNKDIEKHIKPYINIQPRKEGQHGQKSNEATEDRKHSLVIEEVGLSNQGSDTKNAQSKRRTKRKQNIK